MINLSPQRIKTTDGITLSAYTAGDSRQPALVFVHGYPDDHTVWLPLMQQFVDDYFIVAYDVRGAGESDAPKQVSSYQLSQLADDLWEVTQQVLGDKPFHVIGHDWGSIQTWEPACQQRFRGKMLSFTSISGPCLDHVGHITTDMSVSMLKKANQFLRSWYVYSFQLPVIPRVIWQYMAPRWHKVSGLPKNPDQLAQSITGMNLYKANILQRQTRPRDMYTVCPVQVIVMTKDTFVTPILYDNVEKWVPELTRDELPLDHWDIHGQAERVAEKIRPYLLKILNA